LKSWRLAEHLLRDIYYIDPEFFRAQYIVDGIVDDLAYTIGVDRAALNVVSIVVYPGYGTATSLY
jgi:DNA topoisomerase VI subunit A